MRNFIISIVILVLLFVSCHKKKDAVNNSTPDYLIFGITAGAFCSMAPGVDCALVYKIENKKLFADSMRLLDEFHLVFQTDPRPNSDYLIVAPLIDSFPDYLVRNDSGVYGCPGCMDQGIIFIQTRHNNVVRKWTIDSNINALPVEIRSFADSVISKAYRLR